MRSRTLVIALLALAAVAAALWVMRPDAPAAPPVPTATNDAAAAGAAAAAVPATSPPSADAAEAGKGDPQRTAAPAAAAGFIVRGRAVRAVDEPAPGARVRARAFAGTAARGEPQIDEVLTANAAGEFTWTLPTPAAITFLDLRGTGDRVRSYPETFVIAPGDEPPPHFSLWVIPLTAVVRGRVLDPKDQPIAGARVGESWRDGVRTAADGTFEVSVEAKASVRLYANAAGFVELRQDVPVDLASGEGRAELRLRIASRIHGRVTDTEQRPVAGATVRTFFTIFGDGAQTDADGRFVLDNLDPGLASHSLFARKEGYVEGKAEVKATGPDVEQDLVLGRGVEVRGVVVAKQGKPVPAATVFLGSVSGYDRLDAVSDADGAFAFPCVAAGEQRLNVERTGFAGKRSTIAVPVPPSQPVVVRVELEPGHFVGGRAVTNDGKPLVGVSIAPRLDGEYLEGIRGKTGADGRFRLDGLPEHGLTLEFYSGGVVRKWHQVPAVDRDDLEVVLERHGSMAGTVVDGRTGAPITTFRIRFGTPRLAQGESSGSGFSAEWLRGGKAFHDKNGVFRIDDEVQVGSVFALEASADGYGASFDDHVVVALDPDPKKTVIALHPGVRIDGFVRERGTALPIAGAKVRAVPRARPLQPSEPNDDVGRSIAETDARGAFRLENVGAGEVSLAIAHPDWLPATHGPIQVAPGASVPLQEIELRRGATLLVDVRDAAGAPMVGADVELLGRDVRAAPARTDANGTARFERVAPGNLEVALSESLGPRKLWTFRRSVKVGDEDCRVELPTKDGDATLVVIVDSDAPLPEGAQVIVLPNGPPSPGRQFRARGAWVRPERTVLTLLPAADLRVMVMSADQEGYAQVTTVAGQQVEVRVTVKGSQGRR